MPFEAMIQSSDSQNPSVADTPLYAVVENGEYALLDVEDTPRFNFTTAGARETKLGVLEEKAAGLVNYLREHSFEATFLIKLVEEAAAARTDNTKTLDDCYSTYAQIFLQLDHCLTRSEA